MKSIFKVLIIFIILLAFSGCADSVLEVRQEGEDYVYILDGIEIKSSIDIYKYIDENNNFNYRGLAKDLNYDKPLCEEDNALCRTYTNNHINDYKLEIYLTGKNTRASTYDHDVISDVGIRIKKNNEKTVVRFARFNNSNAKYAINGSRDLIEIEQIVMLAYLMEQASIDPTNNALSVFDDYKSDNAYFFPY